VKSVEANGSARLLITSRLLGSRTRLQLGLGAGNLMAALATWSALGECGAWWCSWAIAWGLMPERLLFLLISW